MQKPAEAEIYTLGTDSLFTEKVYDFGGVCYI